jgi:hypothetical protein
MDIWFLAAVLPHGGLYLSFSVAALPGIIEAMAHQEYDLLYWLLLGCITAGVTTLTFFTPMSISKLRKKLLNRTH